MGVHPLNNTMPTDWAALHNQGIGLLQSMNSAVKSWTDHNAHDPGITLLDSLCYALSDLSYRLEWSIADLMVPGAQSIVAEQPSQPGFFPPGLLLNCDPVSEHDYRQWLLAQEDVTATQLIFAKTGVCKVALSLSIMDKGERDKRGKAILQALNAKRNLGQVFFLAEPIEPSAPDTNAALNAGIEAEQAIPDYPQGKYRHPAHYETIQNHLPNYYGVGANSLPAGYGETRQAQALDLRRYLLLFDQLLNNYCAQLAGFNHSFNMLDTTDSRGFYAQDLPEDALTGLPGVQPASGASQQMTEAGFLQANKVLDYLLALHDETYMPFEIFKQIPGKVVDDAAKGYLASKHQFLQQMVSLRGLRGQAEVLQQIIACKLGLDKADVWLIDHIVLKPTMLGIPKDKGGFSIEPTGGGDNPNAPFLIAYEDKFYCSCVTVVLPTAFANGDLALFVTTVLAQEMPAHIRYSLVCDDIPAGLQRVQPTVDMNNKQRKAFADWVCQTTQGRE